MISSKEIASNLQFVASRVSNFNLEVKDINIIKGSHANLNFDFDYNILNTEEINEYYKGLIEFIVSVKAKVKNTVLFKLNLNMEGIFIGNKETLNMDEFTKMLKLNGLTTLSQLSRAYLISVTSLSGINPPIKLPLINIFSLINEKEKNAAKKEPQN